MGYRENAAEDSWRRIFAFFDEHLRPISPSARTSPTSHTSPPRTLSPKNVFI